MLGSTIRMTSFPRRIALGLTIIFATLSSLHGAAAETKTHHHHTQRVASTHHRHTSTKLAASSHHKKQYASAKHRKSYASWRSHQRYATQYRHSGIQCVPYAREVSHIQLAGNAFLWWAEASGRYARGNEPMQGAVLNFRAIRRMPLGHVAVVTAVVDSRTILVTQANWVHGTITNDVTVQDVSPNNDWTQVQVELGETSTLGAPYPTYGFIYNQPATTTTIASNDATQAQGNEVAEAPRAVPVQLDAPDRNLQ
jgi:surface antigen